jgi:hypothetical protein
MIVAALLSISQAACSLPPQWGTGSQAPGGDRNVILVLGNRPVWNGVAIDLDTLDMYVEAAAGLHPRPALILEAAAAQDCATLRGFADRIARHGRCTPPRCLVSYRPDLPLGAQRTAG